STASRSLTARRIRSFALAASSPGARINIPPNRSPGERGKAARDPGPRISRWTPARLATQAVRGTSMHQPALDARPRGFRRRDHFAGIGEEIRLAGLAREKE